MAEFWLFHIRSYILGVNWFIIFLTYFEAYKITLITHRSFYLTYFVCFSFTPTLVYFEHATVQELGISLLKCIKIEKTVNKHCVFLMVLFFNDRVVPLYRVANHRFYCTVCCFHIACLIYTPSPYSPFYSEFIQICQYYWATTENVWFRVTSV